MNQEWNHTCFSSKTVLEGLIKLRHKLEPGFFDKRESGIFNQSEMFAFDENITSVYVDLDILIDSCNFSKLEKDFLTFLMYGYTLKDIVLSKFINRVIKEHDFFINNKINYKKFNFIKFVKSMFNNCLKIMWHNVLISQEECWENLNNLKTSDYKKCNKCGRYKKLKYFQADATKPDGFEYNCKICE